MGDSDYFPNGGSDQPQCYGCSYCISENHCSSEESVWYYIDSISKSPCVFVACASLDGKILKRLSKQIKQTTAYYTLRTSYFRLSKRKMWPLPSITLQRNGLFCHQAKSPCSLEIHVNLLRTNWPKRLTRTRKILQGFHSPMNKL